MGLVLCGSAPTAQAQPAQGGTDQRWTVDSGTNPRTGATVVTATQELPPKPNDINPSSMSLNCHGGKTLTVEYMTSNAAPVTVGVPVAMTIQAGTRPPLTLPARFMHDPAWVMFIVDVPTAPPAPPLLEALRAGETPIAVSVPGTGDKFSGSDTKAALGRVLDACGISAGAPGGSVAVSGTPNSQANGPAAASASPPAAGAPAPSEAPRLPSNSETAALAAVYFMAYIASETCIERYAILPPAVLKGMADYIRVEFKALEPAIKDRIWTEMNAIIAADPSYTNRKACAELPQFLIQYFPRDIILPGLDRKSPF